MQKGKGPTGLYPGKEIVQKAEDRRQKTKKKSYRTMPGQRRHYRQQKRKHPSDPYQDKEDIAKCKCQKVQTNHTKPKKTSQYANVKRSYRAIPGHSRYERMRMSKGTAWPHQVEVDVTECKCQKARLGHARRKKT